MRLTIINQFYVPDISPTAHLAASLAQHRAAAGDDVTVITSRGGYVAQSRSEAASAQAENPSVHRIWTPQLGKKNVLKRCIDYACFYIGTLWKAAWLPKQDIVIALTTPPYIAWAAVLHRIIHPRSRVVLWSMDCYPDAAERLGVIRPQGLLSRWMRWMNKRMFSRLDHLICLDSAMVELLGQYAPSDRAISTTIIPNWENSALFPDEADHPPWSPDDAPDMDGKFVVLYLGNTGYGHEFETMLDAAEQLRDEPVMFLFVGGGRRWDELQESITTRELHNIVLYGYVPKDQTASLMQCADSALITLRDESVGVMSPSKLHSNLAMRLPILYVGPEGSNVDDAIERYDCGVSLRVGDVDGLAAHLRRLRDDEQFRSTCRDKARRAFDETYCDMQTMPQFDTLLESLHHKTQDAVCENVHSARPPAVVAKKS